MDYSKAVMSLLHKLQAEGVEIVKVYDGMEWEKVTGDNNLQIRKNATEIITSVDTSSVHVKYQESNATLLIVLGNEESEILADYSGKYDKSDTSLMDIIDKVADVFYAQWE